MDIFLSDALKNKFGHKFFTKIKTQLTYDLQNNGYPSSYIDNNYISYILEISLLEYCDINLQKIPDIIKRMGNNYTPPLNINEIKKIHLVSINSIKNLFHTNIN